MGRPKDITDEQFRDQWDVTPSPQALANKFGISLRNIYARRRSIEARYGVQLRVALPGRSKVYLPAITNQQVDLKRFSGTIVCFSDCHFWPGEKPSPAFEALVKLIYTLKPSVVACVGDVFDGARVSRFGATDYSYRPSVKDELRACQERLDEIESVAGEAKLIWTLGNHDERFTKRLANAAPEYEGIQGTSLQDHFPNWQMTYSLMVNEGECMIKHFFRQGRHATWANINDGGISIVTGHQHRHVVTPKNDYRGRPIWGVDIGCISAFGPAEAKFDYCQNNPLNWIQGFAVLTFKNKKLWPPELVTVIDGEAVFRGQVV